MADTLLHLTAAKHLLNRRNTTDTLRRQLYGCDNDYRFGAVLVDLPYYHNLATSMLRHALGAETVYHPLGNRLHNADSHSMHMAFTERANTRAERATVLGMWTHYAVDAVFHREIEQRLATFRNSGHPMSHRWLEGQMGLHCHWEYTGHSGEGHPDTAKRLHIEPSTGSLRFAARTLRDTTGQDIHDDLLRDWLTSLHLYGVLHSRRFPWVTWLPDDNPELLEVSLQLFEESMDAAASFTNAVQRCMNGELSLSQLAGQIPRVSLLDGTPVKE